MSRYKVSGSLMLAGVFAASLAAAQQPPTQTPQTPQTEPATAQAPASAVTLEGCLKKEADVPGRSPNPAEKAGMMEDFILTGAKVIKGSIPSAGGAPGAKPGDPVGTAGIQPMFEVRGLESDVLKKHANQRVQIDGTVEKKDVRERQQTEAEKGATSKDLPEISGTAIRVVAGSCTGAE